MRYVENQNVIATDTNIAIIAKLRLVGESVRRGIT
jgi:hypothetical protein